MPLLPRPVVLWRMALPWRFPRTGSHCRMTTVGSAAAEDHVKEEAAAAATAPSSSSSSTKRAGAYSADKTTHFGYRTVTEEEKVEKVLGVFHKVADSYDLMNDAMSLGIHRLWKDHFVSVLSPDRRMKLLDLAGGTGDIAFRVLEEMERRRKMSRSPEKEAAASFTKPVTCCDINKSMLEVGRQRAEKLGYPPDRIKWVEGDAQNLPFEDNCFDAYTIAFGIRNVVRIDQALSEAFRVLKPGGRFLCLEFSHVENALLRWTYDQYSFQMIPPMGKILAGDWDSYQYLVESIRKFPRQEEFKSMIRSAGFRAITHENLSFGVAAIHSGFKLE